LDTLLKEGFQRAKDMLKPTPLPDSVGSLKKLAALADSSAVPPERYCRVPINVTLNDHVNHVGVEQKACTLCGDCIPGCNYAAKNAVLINYLPDARNHCAEILTQVTVCFVERHDDRWLVHYRILGTGRDRFDAPPIATTGHPPTDVPDPNR
jgi:cholesterol oxidase